MAIDPMIARGIDRVRMPDPLETAQTINALRTSKTQNELAGYQLDSARREQSQGEALRQFLASANLDDPNVQTKLFGYGKQGAEVSKQLGEQRKTKLDAMDKMEEAARATATFIHQNPTMWREALTRYAKNTGDDVTDEIAELENLDDEGRREWAAGYAFDAKDLLPHAGSIDAGDRQILTSTDPRSNKVSVTGEVARGMRPGEAERIGIDRERLGLEQQRIDLMKNPQLKPLTAAQALKLRTGMAKDRQEAQSTLATLDDVLASAKAVKEAPGLEAATGFGAITPTLPNSAKATAETRLANLRGKVIALGKAAAAASGAIGPIATQEWKILADQIAVLDSIKGKKPMLEQIDLLEKKAQGAAARIREAYDAKYSDYSEQFPGMDLPAQETGGASGSFAPPPAAAPTGGVKFLGFEK